MVEIKITDRKFKLAGLCMILVTAGWVATALMADLDKNFVVFCSSLISVATLYFGANVVQKKVTVAQDKAVLLPTQDDSLSED